MSDAITKDSMGVGEGQDASPEAGGQEIPPVTKKQLGAILDEAGVEYDPKDKRDVLLALVDGIDDEKPEGKSPEEAEDTEKTETDEKKDKKKEPVTLKSVGVRLDELTPDALAELKKEVSKELMGDEELFEVYFVHTNTGRSRITAEKLNAQSKVMLVWEADEGTPKGFIEEVTINGAVAQVPVNIPVLAPMAVKKMVDGYKKAEAEVDSQIPNRQRGQGMLLSRSKDSRETLTR